MTFRSGFRYGILSPRGRVADAPGLLRSSFAPLGLTTKLEACVFLGLAPQATGFRPSGAESFSREASRWFSREAATECCLGRKPQDPVEWPNREKPLQGRHQPHANRRTCRSLIAIGEAQP